MASKIFLNLPVKDLQKSINFFTKLGYTFNPQFTDETATCMIISDTIFAMLLTHAKFKTFTKKEIADSAKTAEVIISLEIESRKKVDEMIRKAKEEGGIMNAEAQDYGWMYMHGYSDLDGHQWELCYMDASAIPQ